MRLPAFAASALLMIAFAAPALADSTAVAKEHSETFSKACAAGDIPGVLALYEDDATVIWPGQGEVAKGKAQAEKLVAATCKAGNQPLKLKSQDSTQVGDDYIVNVGMWEDTVPGPDGKPMTVDVRTTEVLHRNNGKWRYVVDHASIGMPPPAASTPSGQ
jgi:uncharacterized protein (TIGR02246 family)